ncbi:hypothetical protein [Caulobacter sp. LARHSG274]
MTFRAVVYDPPLPTFPFLAVAFMPDGEILSWAFETAEAAENDLRAVAARLEIGDIEAEAPPLRLVPSAKN